VQLFCLWTKNYQLVVLISYFFSKLKYDWNPLKTTINQVKHGISLAEACALWRGPVVTFPSKNPEKLRHLAIGLIKEKHWTVVYALRGDHFRLISARRSRPNEKILFQKLVS